MNGKTEGFITDAALEPLTACLQLFPELSQCREEIVGAYQLLTACFQKGGMVLTCGNGGSAADAEHIVGELMKGFKLPRRLLAEEREMFHHAGIENPEQFCDRLQRALPAVSLVSQTALTTAFINDVAPDMVFAQQVFGYRGKERCLIALSTSGTSKNVLQALKTARACNMKTCGLTGSNAEAMAPWCDVCIGVPAKETFRIQEYHLAVYHALCAMVEATLFENI